jgi:hypothetical protein
VVGELDLCKTNFTLLSYFFHVFIAELCVCARARDESLSEWRIHVRCHNGQVCANWGQRHPLVSTDTKQWVPVFRDCDVFISFNAWVGWIFTRNVVEWTPRLRDRTLCKVSMFVCLLISHNQPVYLCIAPTGWILLRCMVLMQTKQELRRNLRSDCQEGGNLANSVLCLYCQYHFLPKLAL